MSSDNPSSVPPRRSLPRHVVGAISTAIGFAGGIATLLLLPKFGVAPKLAGGIGMVVWLASTWPFWGMGEKGGLVQSGDAEQPKG